MSESLKPFDKARQRSFESGEMILYEGDHSDSIYLIESGQVEVILEDTEQGELILSFLDEGEIFGEMSLFSQEKQRCAMIKAVNKTVVRVCDKNKFLEEAVRDKALWMKLVEQLSNRLRSTNRRYSDRAFHNVKTRIAHILADLGHKSEATAETVQVSVTRTDLGRIGSCSREVAGQAVIELVEEGLLSAAGRNITILDLDALEHYES